MVGYEEKTARQAGEQADKFGQDEREDERRRIDLVCIFSCVEFGGKVS